jgi:hypothetical protein
VSQQASKGARAATTRAFMPTMVAPDPPPRHRLATGWDIEDDAAMVKASAVVVMGQVR